MPKYKQGLSSKYQIFDSLNKIESTSWDSAVPGLGIRTHRTSAIYVIAYSFKSKRVWATIGEISLFALADVRTLAIQVKSLIAEERDPSDYISSFKSGIAYISKITFKEFADIYMERHAKQFKKSWNEDKKRINRYLTEWDHRTLDSIIPADMAKIHNRIGKDHKVAANRLKELVSTMFRLAIVWGYLPTTYLNPVAGVRKFKTRSRKRFIEDYEMAKLAEAVNNYPNAFVKTAIIFDLYTGLRTNELITLKWNQIDLKTGVLTLHAGGTKSGEPLRLPLSDEAIQLLKTLPKNLKKSRCEDWVFPGRIPGSRMHKLDNHWRIIRKNANLEDVNFHDLRRTVGSWLIDQTGNLKLVGTVLNQTTQHVTATYSHLSERYVRNALNEHSDNISHYFNGVSISDS